MFETNSIIRASAGTGKTFALATRFIRLMLIDLVRPETIVALTFSRAAAQEIYTKILDRLCRASTEGLAANGRTNAENEWNLLLEDFHPDASGRERIRGGEAKLKAILADPPPHAAGDFARLLRRLVDTQHLGAIATLDSFILRIVRNFPKEMGVQNAVSVLDPIEENAAVDDAVRRALSRTDGSAKDVAEAFAAAQKGDCPRQCLGAIGSILVRQGWRDFVLAHPECVGEKTRWTVGRMAARLGVDLESVCPDLSGIPFNDVGRKNAVSPEEAFVNFARAYDGTRSFLDVPEGVKKLILFFWTNPGATQYDYRYYRDFTLACGAEGAAAIRAAIRHLANVYLARQLEIVAAKIRLVEAVEGEYERLTRRMGRLTFADFTKYSAEEEFSKRGIALKNVEFRFDSTFDHWALDEFQDTSELQWRCLKELVRNAAEEGHEGGERTAMAVGDMKQSIYTWRGASARPFEDIASWESFAGFERDFSASHRYGPNIAAFVNRVFGLDGIKTGDLIPDVCAGAVAAWRKGWRDHVSNEAPDYVKVVSAAADGDDEAEDELLPALHAEIKALWDRHGEEKSVDTVGVLVRNNDKGLLVADYLRKKGLDVVWEGMSPCGDDPVVQAVLSLLKLAEHPSDTAAWRTVGDLTGIVAVLLPAYSTCEAVSAAVARLLTQQGLARTLKDWCGRLHAGGKVSPEGLTGEKLRQLVEAAVAFEARNTGDGRMLDFIDFVARSGKREIAASSDVIRILTIHRSKGLGVDHVFVPLFEGKRTTGAIDAPSGRSPLYDGGGWVLSHLAKGCEQFNPKTKAAYEKMRGERFAESLRTYYVALTRAKKSMVVVVPEDKETESVSQGLLMRDLIRNAVGGTLPYEAGELPSLAPGKGKEVSAPHDGWKIREKRPAVERVTPSHGTGHAAPGQSVADLFDAESGRAAERGTDEHAAYAKIEWIDPANPADDRERTILATEFRTAFVKPSPEATVWRECRYETLNPQPSVWSTGQFDRVVFSGDGSDRSAAIYDFKTNTPRAEETAEAFVERMRRLYSSQMTSYRQALNRLTGIPLASIKTRLLLSVTGQSVEV